MEKISYESRVYELVDNKNQSEASYMYLKT